MLYYKKSKYAYMRSYTQVFCVVLNDIVFAN